MSCNTIEKLPGSGEGGAVDSVNGATGVVVLDTGDIAEVTDKKYVTDAEKTAIGTIGSKLDANTPITGATKTKITYDADGLVTAGADATTADIADSSNKRYVTDAQLTVIGNTSNTNTGDNATNTQYSGLAASKQDALVSGTNIKTVNSTSLLGSGDVAITPNATHTGEVTGATTLTVDKTAITGKSAVTAVGTDYVLISDTDDSGNLKKALISDFASAGGDMILASAQTNTGAKTFNANTILDKGSQVFNVRAYGAVGDDSNDDTAEIQAAIDAAYAAGSGIVYLPQGIYKISATLQLKSGVSLRGAGTRQNSGTLIKQYSTTEPALTAANSTGVELLGITLEDFAILGPGATSGHGIHLSNTGTNPPHDYFTFSNLYISNFLGSGKWGIKVESLIVSRFQTVIVADCANGWDFDGGSWSTISTSVVLDNCYANNIAGTGYRVYRTNYLAFNACAADVCGTAYLLDEASAVTFNGCGAEWGSSVSPNTGWKLQGYSRGIVLSGCYTYANRGYSIHVAGASACTVLGFMESNPSSATASFLVESGSTLTESDSNLTTATSISGHNNILSNTTGGAKFTTIELGHASDTTIARVSAGVASIEGNNIVTNTSSPTLATITTTGNIELGNASDTTLSRSAAGVLAVEGVVIPSISSTNTLTNKRVTKRTGTTTSSATPTINTDNVDFYSLTAQAADITSFTTNLSGTPTEGQTLWIAITGTGARAITWGSSFEASTVALPTTTVSTNRLDVGFVWNTVTSKWRIIATA